MNQSKWKYYYWIMVVTIFIALIFLVRYVLNSSKVFVDYETPINPYFIEWGLEPDGSLRINEPYFLKTDYSLLKQDEEKIMMDSSTVSTLHADSNSGTYLRDVKKPYLLWKNANSDTIHVLKNNLLLNYKMVEN